MFLEKASGTVGIAPFWKRSAEGRERLSSPRGRAASLGEGGNLGREDTKGKGGGQSGVLKEKVVTFKSGHSSYRGRKAGKKEIAGKPDIKKQTRWGKGSQFLRRSNSVKKKTRSGNGRLKKHLRRPSSCGRVAPEVSRSIQRKWFKGLRGAKKDRTSRKRGHPYFT